jgi:hypothetical protein
MAMKKELSVEDKLRALYDLQLIDSRIDKIRSVRGELPLEVEDLEDEVAGLETRMSKVNGEIEQCTEEIKSKQNTSEHARTMIKKYKDQQKNVRNNRAFESLSKEIEFQELEIELCDKQIKEFKVKIELKNESITQSSEKINERKTHLDHKKNELEDILKETQKEENALIKKSKQFETKIDESLIISYKKIRSSVRNGLAVVAVERGASAGSFFTIPPQVQLDIASRKKLITDEHSGRILVDLELAEEESKKMGKLFTSI